jgi:hypothetical protein
MSRILLFVVFSLFSLQYAKCENYIESCSRVLKMTDITSTRNEVLEYALLLYITKSAKDETEFKSKFAGLTEVGFFDGTLEGARKRLETLEQRLNLHWDYKVSEAYAMTYLPPNASQAFSECVQKVFKTPGLYIAGLTMTDSTITVHIYYNPPTSGVDPKSKLRVITSNADLLKGTNIHLPTTGTLEEDLTFNRGKLSDDAVVNIQVLSYQKPLSGASLQIPPHITRTYSEKQDTVTSELSSTTCSGNNRWQYTYGRDVSLNADSAFTWPVITREGETVDVEYNLDMSTYTPIIELRHETGPGGCGNIVMQRTVPDPKSAPPSPVKFVVAHVVCEPGSDKNHFCDVAGRIQAISRRRESVTHVPQGLNPSVPQPKVLQENLQYLGDPFDVMNVYELGAE